MNIEAEEILKSRSQKVAQGLRELATMIETYPGIPLPYSFDFTVYGASPLEIIGVAKAKGALKTEKKYIGEAFWLEKIFSGDVKLSLHASRETVCKKVIKEVKTVPETIIPEEIIPAKTIPAHEVEVIEWECNPILVPPEPLELTNGESK